MQECGAGHSYSTLVCELEPQLTKFSCHWCIKVLMHCECQQARDHGDGELLPEDRLDEGRHEQSDQDVRGCLCQEAWWGLGFSRLIHGTDLITIDAPPQ